jgi:hypothetical protein
MTSRRVGRAIGIFVAGSLVFSSSAAFAAAAPSPAQTDPWALLSVMSGGASAAAICGAAAAAVTAAQPVGGCVLPQTGVPVAPAPNPPPPPPAPVPALVPAAGAAGISPLLIALAAIAAGVGAFLVLHHHGNSPT